MKNEKNVKKTLNKKVLYGIICFILFIILTILVLTKVTNKIDLAVESSMISIRNEALTKVMIVITNMGRAYALISITFLGTLIAIIKHKRLPLNTIINLISASIIGHLFKLIIRRPRPTGIFLINASGFSYPSCHTMIGFAFYAFIACSLSSKIKNKTIKLFINIITVILVLGIGFSRIYLGVHYLTDVIGGYLLGISYLLLFLNIRAKIASKRQK